MPLKAWCWSLRRGENSGIDPSDKGGKRLQEVRGAEYSGSGPDADALTNREEKKRKRERAREGGRERGRIYYLYLQEEVRARYACIQVTPVSYPQDNRRCLDLIQTIIKGGV